MNRKVKDIQKPDVQKILSAHVQKIAQEAVDSASVEIFQSYLTRVARVRCQQGNVKWMYTHDFRSR